MQNESGKPETTPRRIQRKRTKGWRMPAGAVSVTRPGPYGNPFVVTTKVRAGMEFKGAAWGCIAVPTAEDAVECFRIMLAQPERAEFVEQVKRELSGRDLACFCKPRDPCHADVLLEIANAK